MPDKNGKRQEQKLRKKQKQIEREERRERKRAANGGSKHDGGKVIKEKFQEERKLKPITPMTQKQAEYIEMLNDSNIQIIVAEGLFGTGKSFCSAAVAAEKYRINAISRIIVARAYVQTGKTSGFKPGGTLDKLYPYVRNALDIIQQRIGKGAYQVALGNGTNGTIEVQEVESIRGRSFDEPSFLLIEEAQQTSPEEMQSIVTRIGEGCKLIISGCDNQRDIKGQSGLSWFKSFARRHQLKNVGFIDFDDPEDIVRSGIVKDIAYGLAKDAENPKFQ